MIAPTCLFLVQIKLISIKSCQDLQQPPSLTEKRYFGGHNHSQKFNNFFDSQNLEDFYQKTGQFLPAVDVSKWNQQNLIPFQRGKRFWFGVNGPTTDMSRTKILRRDHNSMINKVDPRDTEWLAKMGLLDLPMGYIGTNHPEYYVGKRDVDYDAVRNWMKEAGPKVADFIKLFDFDWDHT